ncbi:MAG TPA: DUF1326 domain-containing protein [Blastocatellia bacterium]
MKRLWIFAAAAAVTFCFSSIGNAQHVSGDYIETRTADVYTGPCFANSEVNLVGNEAILAWKINKGDWNGAKLDGLSVVAVVHASGTLGDPFENPLPAKSVLIVDQKGTPEQQKALMSFAQAMGGDLLKNAVSVQVAPIDMEVSGSGMHHSGAWVRAGSLAEIKTRSINEKDHLCGNEESYYPPLAETSHSMPAVALVDKYDGPSLGVSWDQRDKRSAFVGSFER